MYGNPHEDTSISSLSSKPPEKIKEDIIGLKTIIESLAEEVSKLETKKKQHITEIKNNENLLNNILEDLSKDNKNFLSKLQTAVDKKSILTLTAFEPFVKRNFRKIKEMLEEKSINLEADTKKSADRKSSNVRSRNNSRASFDEKADQTDRGKELELENQFIFKKITKEGSRQAPAFIRNLALSQK